MDGKRGPWCVGFGAPCGWLERDGYLVARDLEKARAVEEIFVGIWISMWMDEEDGEKFVSFQKPVFNSSTRCYEAEVFDTGTIGVATSEVDVSLDFI